MVGSRTIKVLAALFVAMIIGSIALIALETAPAGLQRSIAAISEPGEGLWRALYRTSVPVQPVKWRNVVVHASGAERPDVAAQCHFVVRPDGESPARCVRMTALWDRQAEGNHVYLPGRDFNRDSIGICLLGDFSTQPPSPTQMKALTALVQSLQRNMNISADHVYLHSDLDARSRSPGEAFPAAEFSAALLRPGR